MAHISTIKRPRKFPPSFGGGMTLMRFAGCANHGANYSGGKLGPRPNFTLMPVQEPQPPPGSFGIR